MELRQLKYFKAVVEHGTFSAAADALHMTQPSVSVAVRQLEKEVGASLLQRGPKGVQTTDAGEVVLKLARQLDEQIQQTVAEVDAIAHGESGSVQLAITTEGVWEGLPGLLHSCWQNHPDLHIAVGQPAPREIMSDLLAGLSDVAIIPTIDPVALEVRHSDTVGTWRLDESEFLVATSEQLHPAEEALSFADLANQRWFTPTADSWFQSLPNLLLRHWAQHPDTRPSQLVEISSLQNALPVIGSGAGVTLVPRSTQHLTAPGLRLVPLADDVPHLVLLAVWDATKPMAPATKHVLDIMKEISKG